MLIHQVLLCNFTEDMSQNNFIFQAVLEYFKASRIAVNAKVRAWTFKGLSSESIKPPAIRDNNLSPKLDYFNKPKFRLKHNGSCLKTDRALKRNKIVILYIV